MNVRITHRISELPPEEARALADALHGLRRLVLAQARRGDWRRWRELRVTGSNQTIALRARPGPFGFLTEATLYGRKPWPNEADARALAQLLGLRHFVIDWLNIQFLIREASYAVGESDLAAATT